MASHRNLSGNQMNNKKLSIRLIKLGVTTTLCTSGACASSDGVPDDGFAPYDTGALGGDSGTGDGEDEGTTGGEGGGGSGGGETVPADTGDTTDTEGMDDSAGTTGEGGEDTGSGDDTTDSGGDGDGDTTDSGGGGDGDGDGDTTDSGGDGDGDTTDSGGDTTDSGGDTTDSGGDTTDSGGDTTTDTGAVAGEVCASGEVKLADGVVLPANYDLFVNMWDADENVVGEQYENGSSSTTYPFQFDFCVDVDDINADYSLNVVMYDPAAGQDGDTWGSYNLYSLDGTNTTGIELTAHKW